jgi:ABC-2 type transport system permease protein
MTILLQEIKQQKVAILIWSLSIGLLIAVCVLMYPEMKSEMDGVNELFASMGSFTAAFGMDRLNFGTLIGFYAVEGGNILAIGGAFFAAITAISALLKEEKERTAEFLLTHPVSRAKVVTGKLLSVYAIILILNAIVLVCSLLSVAIIGEEIDLGLVLLFHLAYLLMQFVIAGICFGISAFLSRSGIGIGIGIAAVMYFLNIVANISKDAEVLKYITPFGFCEGADLINDKALNVPYLCVGLCLMAAGIAAAYVKYCRKDINA